ncbi:hypothetical protein [Sphingomonas cavernae]|uniref:LRAT domain-containing protein n=1 Tax=Sphingomonas cavernae TaxID=2320861 RepID=A0A418WQQ7_9SPHN|nr:hypothetical protein [Sphingomonas cavernae]RJF93536.1 hypothetical protein D3876_04240 [Sphingomonas cavernae]
MYRLILAPILFLLLNLASPAAAQVVVTFYSHDLDDHFPHAFFTLKGTTIEGGEVVDTNYGFTAKTIGPAILFGSVPGRIDIAKPGYVAHSTAHFSLTLTDEQYRAILGVVEKWRNAAGDSYDMNRSNCVHFTGEAAQAIGLNVTFPKKLMKKPRSYLDEVQRLNPQLVDLRVVERKKQEASRATTR